MGHVTAPFFTIVTITLENAPGLRRTLASIAAQTCRDFELIVVDGGSRDDTTSVVSSFGALVTRFTSEPDRGIVDAFNKGTSAARGRLVNYLNAGDEFLHENVLLRVREEWQRRAFVWAFGLSRRVDGEGRRYPPRPQQLLPYTYERLARGTLFVSHQATFFDTEELREMGGYDPAFQRQGMDYELMLRLGKRHQPSRIDEALVLYEDGGVSAHHNFAGLMAKHRARVAVLELSEIARIVDAVRTLARYANGRARHVAKRALLRFPWGRTALERAGALDNDQPTVTEQ
jgi:glycosyltransferase involved in cell wall biosynthesis